ncbi:MAG: ribosomal RNA small subunit methyltransferase A [Chloroflexi bacterium]|nr:ribosomal RNA small subunit methyltransferase A [Chloroflexota bacterium]
MKLTEIKQVLASGQIQLTKSLGQNFLHDGNQLRRMISAAELRPNDQVLEIGSGLGPLTELLLAKAGRVLAIEKDRRLYEFLEHRLPEARNLTLIHADALDYLEENRADWSAWKSVSNLPFSVASPILVRLAQMTGSPERLVATLQVEVAQRLFAEVGDKDYGLLTLLVELRYEPQNWFKVPATCFFPQPSVDSACVVLERRAQPLLNQELTVTFTQVARRSFSQRRKMMFKLLKEDWPAATLAGAFEQLKLPAQIRAEAVSLEQFVQLTKLLSNSRRDPAKSQPVSNANQTIQP